MRSSLGVTTPLAAREDVPNADGVPGDHVPHVVAWNLTRRCNLECAHCYISAGPSESADDELSTAECVRIAGEILEINPAPMFILSGGEPLLRSDLTVIAGYASSRGATVVVGTNGTLLTDGRIAALQEAGVTGVAVSIDSLDSRHHDNFRHGQGAFHATAAAVERLRTNRLDFIVQTALHKGNRQELGRLVDWAADQGAVSFNCYFLVATGRGSRLSDLSSEEYEAVLEELVDHHTRYLGRMLVRAKCAPHFMRVLHRKTPESPALNYSTRCPCGVHYCRITPDGKLTPCPYLPAVAGDLRRERFETVWREADLFRELRGLGSALGTRRSALGGKCGRCEYSELCGGCRARAFALTGDYLAEDPSCAYQPAGGPVIERMREVTYGMPVTPTLRWSATATERLQRIPSFVRGVVTQRIEDYARRTGASEVTPELMREVRRSLPVDFSRRLPFFADDA
ncbi:MAG: radical SAM protein [Gemmatimonadales bacterium]